MKFKFKGESGMIDYTLIQAGILPMDEKLVKGKEYEIPEDKQREGDDVKVIERLRANGLWKEVKETKPHKKAVEKDKENTKPIKGGD